MYEGNCQPEVEIVERIDGRPGSQGALHVANQRRVVGLLQSAGEMTQARIARATGLAPATVSNIVRELTSGGVLVLSDMGGRRAICSTRSGY